MMEMRPRLHRYCSRMVGSAFEGEDVVQEALANAIEAASAAGEISQPGAWLLRIAHNAALDTLRRRKRQGMIESEEVLLNVPDVSAKADVRVANTASLTAFLHLSIIQRSSVVLSDVLGYSLIETAGILEVSVPSVKAALHRGRARLREFLAAPEESVTRLPAIDREKLQAYAELFNSGQFDALRDLLSEEVRLDLVNRTRQSGRKQVSSYFSRYEQTRCQIAMRRVEDRLVLVVTDPNLPPEQANYLIRLDWEGSLIKVIQDFRYAPYIMASVETYPA